MAAQEVKSLRIKMDTRQYFGTRRAVTPREPVLQAHSAWAGWPQLRVLRDMQGGEELFWDYSRCVPLTHTHTLAHASQPNHAPCAATRMATDAAAEVDGGDSATQ